MWLAAAVVGARSDAIAPDADDRDWLRRLPAGDADAAARLYDRHARAVYSLVLRIVEDEDDAEDAMQDLFVRARTQAARDDSPRGPVDAWLLALGRRIAIGKLRARRARSGPQTIGDETAIVTTPRSGGEGPSDPNAGDMARLLRRAIGELPLLQRMAIELAYYEGLKQREVADRLEEPLATVRARIRTGLVKLRDATAGAAVVRAAHPDAEGSVGAYVLGTLDADERRAFEAHLAGCADCAAEAESLRPVADALAVAVPQRTPRPELRSRVLGALAEDAPPPRARGADRMPRFDVRRWLSAGLLLGARRRRVRPGPDVGRRPAAPE